MKDKDKPPIIVIKIIVRMISTPGIEIGKYVLGLSPVGISFVDELIKNLLK
jgi:hypothetical protein